METIKKILVPTDFSENASLAYPHSQEIAHRFGAKIDFIHIIPTLRYFNESVSRLGVPLDMEEDLYPKAQEEAIQKMKELMASHISEEHRGKAICRIARKPWSMMAELAEKKLYDLVVMASKGRHESHLLRGSTTEKMIRHSTTPVFTVDATLSSEGLERILVPTDGSRLSLSALPMALSLADIYHAEIIFYHAVELYGSPMDEGWEGDPDKTEEANIYEAFLDHLEEYLQSDQKNTVHIARGESDFHDEFLVTDEGSRHGIPFQTVIEKSVTAHVGIENYAADYADLVVMATHGHSGWAHLFLGSTTEKVAQYLDIPVVTIKPDPSALKER
ncbi:universal stress protein [Fodinibius sediminis]|uniref:Nucleotide-binding universal stress protein, UspA family n=1 Tax=Fodinibius sediminis TaxID=1214077 RepID=A0A521BWT7_9BACT|nr:universal stress protein [Fodinibius sediminis]SMO51677.1 Nucleotide-binding universal stress protein, UspA family [Fodinibius sediminis]